MSGGGGQHNLGPGSRGSLNTYNWNSTNLIRSNAQQLSNYPTWMTTPLRPNLAIARLPASIQPSSALLSRSALLAAKLSSPSRPNFRITSHVPSHVVPARSGKSKGGPTPASTTPPQSPLPQTTRPSTPPSAKQVPVVKPQPQVSNVPMLMVTPIKAKAKNVTDSPLTASTSSASTGLAALPSRTNTLTTHRSFSAIRSYSMTERSRALRLRLERAIKDRKIFSVMGVFPAVKKALIRRGWMEKNLALSSMRPGNFSLGLDSSNKQFDDESDQAWISRVLRDYPPDFIWTHRRDGVNWSTLNPSQIVNRHPKAVFTSKVGIAACLQNLHWFAEANVSTTYFPRCYRLCIDEEKLAFMNDFRLCACMSLLKWLIAAYEKVGEDGVMDNSSPIPASIVEFATKKLYAYSKMRRHEDLDSPVTAISASVVTAQAWELFLRQYHAVVMDGTLLFPIDSNDSALARYEQAKKALKKVATHWPQISIDGINNVWICKPGARSRGNGIVLMNQLDRILALLQHSNVKENNWVVQKYIERPMLIYKTKFDIRQWFVVTDWNPLTVWCYKESYIRFCSKPFSLTDLHESIHLCNNAVQARYTNSDNRDAALPVDNMWDNYTFQAYLRHIGYPNVWEKVIYPGMKQGILGVLLASQENADFRKNCFELYGADFMLSEDFTPWMIEVNSSPCMASTTSVTARMCGECLEDVMKVIIDRRDNRMADTGLFELIYKQQHSSMPFSVYSGSSGSGVEYTVYGQKVGGDIDWSSRVTKHRSRQSLTGTNASVGGKHKSSGSIHLNATIADLVTRIKLQDVNGFTGWKNPENPSGATGSLSVNAVQEARQSKSQASKASIEATDSKSNEKTTKSASSISSSNDSDEHVGGNKRSDSEARKRESKTDNGVHPENILAKTDDSEDSVADSDMAVKSSNQVKFSIPSAGRKAKRRKSQTAPMRKGKSRENLSSARSSSQSVKSQESAKLLHSPERYGSGNSAKSSQSNLEIRSDSGTAASAAVEKSIE